MSSKRTSFIMTISAIVFIASLALLVQSLTTLVTSKQVLSTTQHITTPTPPPSITTIPTKIIASPAVQKLPTQQITKGNTYTVVKVVDGDTFEINDQGKIQKVRLIGIDTPEVVDPRKPVQCFGREASNKAKEILTGQQVRLESDPTQDNVDKYGRLLRYAFLSDGTNFNEMMIREGYAFEYTYQIPYQYQIEFKAAQQDAKAHNRGLWAPDTCNGVHK